MKEVIDSLSPPGIEKTRRGKLFAILQRMGDLIAQDAKQVLYNFFPFLSDEDSLSDHAQALGIPRYSADTLESFRRRVSAASFYLQQRGQRGFINTELAKYFNGRRYETLEEFLKLYVKALDMSNADRAWLWEFLGAELDPNIELSVIDWFSYIEQIVTSEDVAVAAVKRDEDYLPAGLRHDGRILFDHGESVLFDGSYLHDAPGAYCGFFPVQGTERSFIYVPANFAGHFSYGDQSEFSGYMQLPAIDPLNRPATYDNRQDEFSLQIMPQLFDELKIAAFHDGAITFSGLIGYTDDNPSLLDDMNLVITQQGG